MNLWPMTSVMLDRRSQSSCNGNNASKSRDDLHQDTMLAGLADGIDFKIAELGQFALSFTFVLDTLVAALSWRVGGHGDGYARTDDYRRRDCCASVEAGAGWRHWISRLYAKC